jgi:hypothetical protein
MLSFVFKKSQVHSLAGGFTMKKSLLGLALCASLVLAAVPEMAHHSFSAEFDSTKQKTVRGFVTKVDWANPHVWIYLNVKDEKGVTSNWGFEMGPPHLLQGGANPWKKDTVKIGDEIEVNGSLAKNGSKRLNARNVIFVKTGLKVGTASSEGQAGQQ